MQNEQRAVQDQDPSEWSRVVGDETGWLTAYVARRVPESALEDVLHQAPRQPTQRQTQTEHPRASSFDR